MHPVALAFFFANHMMVIAMWSVLLGDTTTALMCCSAVIFAWSVLGGD